MPFVWDPDQGRYVDQELEQEMEQQAGFNPATAPLPELERRAGLPAWDLEQRQREYQRDQAVAEQEAYRQRYEAQGDDLRPLLPQSPMDWIGDGAKVTANAVLAPFNDVFVDIPSYVGDAIGGLYDQVTTGEANWETRFNDADNPITQMRRRVFQPSSQGAQLVSNVGRFIPFFAQMAVSGGTSALGKLPMLGKIAKLGKTLPGAAAVGKAVGFLNKVDDLPVTTIKALRAKKGFQGASSGKKLLDAIEKAPYLQSTFADVSKAAQATAEGKRIKSWWQSTEQAAAILASPATEAVKRPKRFLKTMGEVAAWDLFIAFNVASEGEVGLDENIFDMVAEWDWLPPEAQALASPLATRRSDSALSLKLKQMADAALTGIGAQALFDVWRIAKYADNFKKATPKQRKRILELFEDQAAEMGADAMVSASKVDDALTAGPRAFEPGARSMPSPAGIESPWGADITGSPGGEVPFGGAVREPWGREVADTVAQASPVVQQLDAARLVSEGPRPTTPTWSFGEEARRVGRSEPVASPGNFRSAFEQLSSLAWQAGFAVEQREMLLSKLLPKMRTTALEYLRQLDVRAGLGGVLKSDSYLYRRVIGRGLEEGWARINPETFAVETNFSLAKQADVDASAARWGRLNDNYNQGLLQERQARVNQLQQMAADEDALRRAEETLQQGDQAVEREIAQEQELLEQAGLGEADEAVRPGARGRAAQEAFEQGAEERLLEVQQQAQGTGPVRQEPSDVMRQRSAAALDRFREFTKATGKQQMDEDFLDLVANDPVLADWIDELDAEYAAKPEVKELEAQIAEEEVFQAEAAAPPREFEVEPGDEDLQAIEAEVVEETAQSGGSIADLFRAENDRLFNEGMQNLFQMGRKIKTAQAMVDQLADMEGLPRAADEAAQALPAAAEEAVTGPPMGQVVELEDGQFQVLGTNGKPLLNTRGGKFADRRSAEKALVNYNSAQISRWAQENTEEAAALFADRPVATIEKDGRQWAVKGPAGEGMGRFKTKAEAEEVRLEMESNIRKRWKLDEWQAAKQEELDQTWRSLETKPEVIEPSADVQLEIKLTKRQAEELGEMYDIVADAKGNARMTMQQAAELYGKLDADFLQGGGTDLTSPSMARSIKKLARDLGETLNDLEIEAAEANDINGLLESAQKLADDGMICDL